MALKLDAPNKVNNVIQSVTSTSPKRPTAGYSISLNDQYEPSISPAPWISLLSPHSHFRTLTIGLRVLSLAQPSVAWNSPFSFCAFLRFPSSDSRFCWPCTATTAGIFQLIVWICHSVLMRIAYHNNRVLSIEEIELHAQPRRFLNAWQEFRQLVGYFGANEMAETPHEDVESMVDQFV